MTTQTHERSEANAGKISEQLATQLITPLQDTLLKYEIAFPGIATRFADVIRQEVIQAALSAEAAQSIASLIKEGTPKSIEKALAAVKEFRALVERGGSVDLAEVQALMPFRFVGPDARIFKGRDIGEVPALPANILEVLKSKCTLAKDGRTVAETHRLVLVPKSIDGRPLTLDSLSEFAFSAQLATSARAEVDPTFVPDEYPNEDEDESLDEPEESLLEKSVWVLEYENIAPGTCGLNDSEQRRVLDKLRNYRTASILEHVGTMAFLHLEHGERIFTDLDARFEDWMLDEWECFAGFTDHGILISWLSPLDDPSEGADAGRAIVRKFDTP